MSGTKSLKNNSICPRVSRGINPAKWILRLHYKLSFKPRNAKSTAILISLNDFPADFI